MEDITNVLERIKTQRKNKGISHEDLAFKLGISQAAYTNIENQTSKLSVERLMQISDILQEPVYTFFNESPKTVYNIKENSIEKQEIQGIYNLNKEMLDELVKSKDDQIALLKSLQEKK
jgi:transcriptional regulator with XRE-family HTH domain